MLEGPGLDEAGVGRVVKGRRLGAAEGLQCGGGDGLACVSGQVEENHRDAGVGQMSGDAHAHGSGTQDCSLLNHPWSARRRAGRRGG